MSISICSEYGVSIPAKSKITKAESSQIQEEHRDVQRLKDILALIEWHENLEKSLADFDNENAGFSEEVFEIFKSSIETASSQPSKSILEKMILALTLMISGTNDLLQNKKRSISTGKTSQIQGDLKRGRKLLAILNEVLGKKDEVKQKMIIGAREYELADLRLMNAEGKPFKAKQLEAIKSTVGILAGSISLAIIKVSLGSQKGETSKIWGREGEVKGIIMRFLADRSQEIKKVCSEVADRNKQVPMPQKLIGPVEPPKPAYQINYSAGLLAGYGKELEENPSSLSQKGLRTALKGEVEYALDRWAVGLHYTGTVPYDLENGGAPVFGHDRVLAYGEKQVDGFGILGQVGYEYFGSINPSKDEPDYDAFALRFGTDYDFWEGLGFNARSDLLIGRSVEAEGQEPETFFDGDLTLGLHWRGERVVPFAEFIVGYEPSGVDLGGALGVGLPFTKDHELNAVLQYTKQDNLLAALHHFSTINKYFEIGAQAEFMSDFENHDIGGRLFVQIPFGDVRLGGERMGAQLSFDGNSSPLIGGFGAFFIGNPQTPSALPAWRPYSQTPDQEMF